MKRRGGLFLWSLLLVGVVLGGCNSDTEKTESTATSVEQQVSQDYETTLSDMSDVSYKDSKGKTAAISEYGEQYGNAYGPPMDDQQKTVNTFLEAVADSSYKNGTSNEKAEQQFLAYFLQSKDFTKLDPASDEYEFSKAYYYAVRSAIRIEDAKILNDEATKKHEKNELKKYEEAMATYAKKFGTVKGDQAYAKLTPKPAKKVEKPKASANAEKVTIVTTTPQKNPSSADNERYHDITGYAYVNTGDPNDGLVLRKGPGVKYGRVLQRELPNGESLTLIGRQGDWYNVYVDNYGLIGWVHGSYVTSTRPATVSSASPSYLIVNTGWDTLSLRTNPDPTSRKIAAIPDGESVIPGDYKNGWYYVYVPYFDEYGWVSGKFLRKP